MRTLTSFVFYNLSNMNGILCVDENALALCESRYLGSLLIITNDKIAQERYICNLVTAGKVNTRYAIKD